MAAVAPRHPQDYAELYALSNFSFLRGASHPKELVERAAELGYTALALTDECSLAGVVRAWEAARKHGVKLIVGSEIRLADGPTIVLLVADETGYGGLVRLITLGRRRAEKGQYRLERADLDGGVNGCLAILADSARWSADARWLGECFPGRAWVGVTQLRRADDAAVMTRCRAAASVAGLPLVALGGVLMHERRRKPLHDVVTAIRRRTTLREAGFALESNGERHLRERERLAALYPPELLAATVHIAGRCRFRLDSLRYQYPDDDVPAGESAAGWLRKRVEEGVRRRWPQGESAKVRDLITRELRIIGELGYEPYFLTIEDIVRFARSQGILCQGRGSAANSAVCYALGITSVDPDRQRVLFERFISKERGEPPDIDVDFEHERREEVMQYIYRRYGRERAALTATVITYRRKSALREVAKVFGLEPDQIDRLVANLARWDEGITPQALREAGFDPANPVIGRIYRLACELMGFPRHLSQHVGGFVIAKGLLADLVPVENAAMADRTVIQWDKDDLDIMGLMKVDCLALGMLSAIRRCFDLLRAHRGRDFDLASIPSEDKRVYGMIEAADTVGVFQIESRAQMSMLPRLKPRTFYDLVIEVAIVRPGPIQGNMVHPYLKRREGLEVVDYPTSGCRHVLERTLGVPLFQEQVIELAVVAAGFTPGEADDLRRSMAAWKRHGGLEPFQERLREGMAKNGIGEDYAKRIYQQILGFGDYGFPESHAASFALLVYASAWLKYHHPAVFCCALLNSQPMGFYAPAQLVQDARRHDVEVRPVRVETSDWDCTLEPAAKGALALRLGFRQVKGMSREGARRVVLARAQGPFADTRDLVRRATLSQRDIQALAAADALADLAGHRRLAGWAALDSQADGPLFETAPVQEELPLFHPPGEGESVVADYASIRLSLRNHPVGILRPRLVALKSCSARDIGESADGDKRHYIGLVTNRQQPGSSKGTLFVTLEDETGCVNVIVWDRVKRRHRRTLMCAMLMGITGTVRREGRVIHLVADRLSDHSPLLGTLKTRSRDFH